MSAVNGGAARITRATLALISITLLAKLFGFGEKQVIAYYFGAGAEVDAYFVAFSVPLALFLFCRELVEPAFLPLFVGHLDAGRTRRAARLFAAVAIGVAGVLVPLAVAGGVGADRLAGWLAPGFDTGARAVTAGLIRAMIGAGVLLGLSSLTYITLNGYRRFALPASGDLVQKALPVVAAVALVSQLGITALAVGVVAGSAGRLLVHLAGLAREREWLALPSSDSREDVQALLLLMAPLALGMLFSQLSSLADNYFSSQVGEGGVAARTFAFKIVELPVLLVPYALSVVVFPHFASLASRADWGALYAFLGGALRGLAILFALLGVGMAALAEPLVTLLFERGAFDAGARAATAWPLRLYALGLVSFALEAILVPFYFALRDTRTPVAVGILGQILNVALTALWIGPLGVGGVALAYTVARTAKVLALGLLLGRKRPVLSISAAAGPLLRIGVAAAVTGAALAAALGAVGAPGAQAPLVVQALYLVAFAGTGSLLFLGCLVVARTPERAYLLGAWRSALQFVRSRGRTG